MRIGPRRAPSEYAQTAAWGVAVPQPIDHMMVWRVVMDGGGVPREATVSGPRACRVPSWHRMHGSRAGVRHACSG